MSGTMSGMRNVERCLGAVSAVTSGGPVCLVTAGIHGNEPAGIHALRRVFQTIQSRSVPIQGRFAAFSGNRAGLAQNVRFVDEDMNRVWSAERILGLRGASDRQDTSEQREQRDLLAHIEIELSRRSSRVTHLDLHSTSGDGPPFTVVAGPRSSRDAANNLGVPLLIGLEAIIAGTLIEHLGARGHTTVLLEGGQNEATSTIDHHESAVWLTLVESEVVLARDVPDLAFHRERLRGAARDLPGELEIAYCHRIEPGEDFAMLPGYASFDSVSEGQLLARTGPRLEREVRAPWTGTLLMPRYQGQGLDGFFLGRRAARGA